MRRDFWRTSIPIRRVGKSYCDVIVDEAAKMNNMVKKLLTLNQLEAGNDVVSMERFDITALVHNYLQSAELLAKQNGISVHMDQTKEIYVWGDEFKIEEVLMNYFSNAVNHCEKEKVVEVEDRGNGRARQSFGVQYRYADPGGFSAASVGEVLQGGQGENEGIRRKRYRTVDRQGNYGVDEPEIRRNQLRKRR